MIHMDLSIPYTPTITPHPPHFQCNWWTSHWINRCRRIILCWWFTWACNHWRKLISHSEIYQSKITIAYHEPRCHGHVPKWSRYIHRRTIIFSPASQINNMWTQGQQHPNKHHSEYQFPIGYRIKLPRAHQHQHVQLHITCKVKYANIKW